MKMSNAGSIGIKKRQSHSTPLLVSHDVFNAAWILLYTFCWNQEEPNASLAFHASAFNFACGGTGCATRERGQDAA
jgi:hypothetical protein